LGALMAAWALHCTNWILELPQVSNGLKVRRHFLWAFQSYGTDAMHNNGVIRSNHRLDSQNEMSG
jgi:hypothetical protein